MGIPLKNESQLAVDCGGLGGLNDWRSLLFLPEKHDILNKHYEAKHEKNLALMNHSQ